WTQDHKVFAILAGSNAIVEQCAKNAGAVELTSGFSASVPETYREFPNYLEISGLNLVRMGPVTVDGLIRQGYFGKGSRVGIVTWDTPVYREAIEKGFVPALRRRGLSLAA